MNDKINKNDDGNNQNQNQNQNHGHDGENMSASKRIRRSSSKLSPPRPPPSMIQIGESLRNAGCTATTEILMVPCATTPPKQVSKLSVSRNKKARKELQDCMRQVGMQMQMDISMEEETEVEMIEKKDEGDTSAAAAVSSSITTHPSDSNHISAGISSSRIVFNQSNISASITNTGSGKISQSASVSSSAQVEANNPSLLQSLPPLSSSVAKATTTETETKIGTKPILAPLGTTKKASAAALSSTPLAAPIPQVSKAAASIQCNESAGTTPSLPTPAAAPSETNKTPVAVSSSSEGIKDAEVDRAKANLVNSSMSSSLENAELKGTFTTEHLNATIDTSAASEGPPSVSLPVRSSDQCHAASPNPHLSPQEATSNKTKAFATASSSSLEPSDSMNPTKALPLSSSPTSRKRPMPFAEEDDSSTDVSVQVGNVNGLGLLTQDVEMDNSNDTIEQKGLLSQEIEIALEHSNEGAEQDAEVKSKLNTGSEHQDENQYESAPYLSPQQSESDGLNAKEVNLNNSTPQHECGRGIAQYLSPRKEKLDGLDMNRMKDFATPRRSGTGIIADASKGDASYNRNHQIVNESHVETNIRREHGTDTNRSTKNGNGRINAINSMECNEVESDSDFDMASPSPRKTDYYQKAEAKRKRNQQRLMDLGLTKFSCMVTNVSKSHDVRKNKIGISNSKYRAIGDTHQEEDSAEFSDEESRTCSLPTGMRFATRDNSYIDSLKSSSASELDYDYDDTKRTSSLFEQFPHRRKQIILLQSFVMNAVRQTELELEVRGINKSTNEAFGSNAQEDIDVAFKGNAYIPPPILIKGASGTGKTSVVKAVLKQMKREIKVRNKNGVKDRGSRTKDHKNQKIAVGIAHINCSTIEPYGHGAGSILENIYCQFANQFEAKNGSSRQQDLSNSSKRENSHSAESSISLISGGSESGGASFDDTDTDEYSFADGSLDGDSLSAGDGIDDGDDNQSVCDEEDMIEDSAARERGNYIKFAKTTTVKAPASAVDTTSMPNRSLGVSREAPRRSSRLGSNKFVTNPRVPVPRKKMKTSGILGLLSTPTTFGRAVAEFCGVSKYNADRLGCAFLVLDHADKLLCFSHSKQKNSVRTNFLSELLLLPKVMKLNLTIIIVTDKMFLGNTRISNIEFPTNTLGTINAAVAPVVCHFDAYDTKEMCRDILATSHLMYLVTGISQTSDTHLPQSLLKQLYESLVDIIIQSIENTTHDMREMLRLARMLWPIYINPLGKNESLKLGNESGTNNDYVDNKILERLGEELRPHIRQTLSRCLLRPGVALSSNSESPLANELSYLGKFMLLAAYLCQHNKADQDHILFTNQKGGKRTKKGAQMNNRSGSLTHATSQKLQRELRMGRVSSFPLERMLSVFSSICNKYASIKARSDDAGSNVGNKLLPNRADVENRPINASHLGTISMMNTLSELRRQCLITGTTSTSNSNSNALDPGEVYSRSATAKRFMCVLSRQQILAIAEDVNFPLNEYLMEK